MLRDLLRSHTRLFLDQESHFVPWVYRAYGDPSTEQKAVAMGMEILRVLARRGFQTDLQAEDFASCRSYQEAASLPFRRAADLAGKPRWGDKTPHYVEHIDVIREIFPSSLFIHIVRDGRDVARSMLASHFGPNTIYSAAQTWRRRVRAGIDARNRLGESVVHQLRYEDLLTSPEPCLRELLAFLGEPFEPGVLQATVLAHKPPVDLLAPTGARKRKRNPSAIDPTRAGRWRHSLTQRQRGRFESIAADLLSECGYVIEGLGTPLPRWQRAGWQTVEWSMRLFARMRYADLGREWARNQWLRLRAR